MWRAAAIALVSMLTVSAAAPVSGPSIYVSPRFGAMAEIPEGFVLETVLPGTDGARFVRPSDGAVLTISAERKSGYGDWPWHFDQYVEAARGDGWTHVEERMSDNMAFFYATRDDRVQITMWSLCSHKKYYFFEDVLDIAVLHVEGPAGIEKAIQFPSRDFVQTLGFTGDSKCYVSPL